MKNEKRPVSHELTLIDDVAAEWNENLSFSSFENYFESQTQEILQNHGQYYDGFWKGLKLSEEQLMIVSKECALWISAHTHQLLAYNPFALQKFHREADLIERRPDSGELIYWCWHGDESWQVLTDPENPKMKIWRHYWLKVMDRTPMADVNCRPQFGWFELTPSMNNLYGLRLMVKFEVPVLPSDDCDEFATVIAFCKTPEKFRDECRRYAKFNCEYYTVPQIKLMDWENS